MAFQSDYQHPYANYSTVSYMDHHHSNSPVSPPPFTNPERTSVPQSPSSFIYKNAHSSNYPVQSGVYASDNVSPTYQQPYQNTSQSQPPIMYQPRTIERPNSLDHSTPRHLPAYTQPVSPPEQQYRQEVIPRTSSQPGQEMYATADVQVPLSESEDRQMRYYFPLDSQAHLRRALFHILNSAWKHHNEREPTDEILLQFTSRSGKLYRCLFHKQEGQQCPKEFDRKDRALDHIRTHIDLQPFCCREHGCFQRFCSKPDLLQHEKNKEKTQCDQCGAKILPKNLARHKATNLCRTGRWPTIA
ncbi:hypothetical protein CPB86DRAFT_779162 [Serendipita vermifera]|nr:hypothetical protein CPB86DRAFT_779162 [Serendipita vermifera]